MILLYHKVDLQSLSQFWVDVDSFYRQMSQLADKKVVLLDEYDSTNPDHVVITFDDVYENVYRYAAPILKKFGYRYELFIIGDKIGKNNAFDTVEPLTSVATAPQLVSMVKDGARLQWHTNSHPNFNLVKSKKIIKRELTIAPAIRALDHNGFNWFAYPFGNFTPPVYEQTKQLFRGALSVVQGNNDDRYCLNRLTVVNDTSFQNSTVTVIIPSYNYGNYLVEAIESVLTQTRVVDQIMIVDDGSTDDTGVIGERYQQQYSELITFTQHKRNKGIVGTFNEAVKMATGDYVCILDADNRFRSDFLEETVVTLNKNKNCAIAYTDFALFGQRAEAKYSLFPPEWQGGNKRDRFFIINFPDFTSESRNFLRQRNFIHGNSLFRKKAYLEAGGYRLDGDKPEDHSLFLRMIEKGWDAARVPLPLLEYRQHARHQENDRFNYFAQLNFYRHNYNQLVLEKKKLDEQLTALQAVTPKQLSSWYKVGKEGVVELRKIASRIKRKIIVTMNKLSLVSHDYSKLHLGCGNKIIPGWLNIDIDASLGPQVYKLDLRHRFPFPSGSVSRIFTEHIIENLSKVECRHFLEESYRVLQLKGVMRIAISDLSQLILAYQTKNRKYRRLMQTDMQPLLTGLWDEFLLDMMYNWDRRSYFSYTLLLEFMKRAGFQKIKRLSHGKTNFDFSFDSRSLPDTVYVEAQKL